MSKIRFTEFDGPNGPEIKPAPHFVYAIIDYARKYAITEWEEANCDSFNWATKQTVFDEIIIGGAPKLVPCDNADFEDVSRRVGSIGDNPFECEPQFKFRGVYFWDYGNNRGGYYVSAEVTERIDQAIFFANWLNILIDYIARCSIELRKKN